MGHRTSFPVDCKAVSQEKRKNQCDHSVCCRLLYTAFHLRYIKDQACDLGFPIYAPRLFSITPGGCITQNPLFHAANELTRYSMLVNGLIRPESSVSGRFPINRRSDCLQASIN